VNGTDVKQESAHRDDEKQRPIKININCGAKQNPEKKKKTIESSYLVSGPDKTEAAPVKKSNLTVPRASGVPACWPYVGVTPTAQLVNIVPARIGDTTSKVLYSK
jgi:hypothetical protein